MVVQHQVIAVRRSANADSLNAVDRRHNIVDRLGISQIDSRYCTTAIGDLDLPTRYASAAVEVAQVGCRVDFSAKAKRESSAAQRRVAGCNSARQRMIRLR